MVLIRDSAWNFIGVIVSILSLIVAFLVWRKPWGKKSLKVEMLAKIPLLSIHEEIATRIQVKIDGKIVNNIYLLNFRIVNNGNQPIPSNDFERPISLFLGEHTNLIEASIQNVFPNSIKPSIEKHGNHVILNPLLLNPNDFIVIKLILTKYAGDFTIDARITGIKEIEYDPKKIEYQPEINLLTTILPPVIMLAATIIAVLISKASLIISIPLFILSLGFPLANLITYWQKKRDYIEAMENTYSKQELNNHIK
jgi:hypothetical protein